MQLTAEEGDPIMIHKSPPLSRETIDKTQRQYILHASKIGRRTQRCFGMFARAEPSWWATLPLFLWITQSRMQALTNEEVHNQSISVSLPSRGDRTTSDFDWSKIPSAPRILSW